MKQFHRESKILHKANQSISSLDIEIACLMDVFVYWVVKGNLWSKKSLAQMKERENAKQRAITDLNAPNGSRDIPFQSQELEQYGRRHFVDF